MGFVEGQWVADSASFPRGGELRGSPTLDTGSGAHYDVEIRAIVINERSSADDILHEYGHAHDHTSGAGSQLLRHIDRSSVRHAERQVLLGLYARPRSSTPEVMSAWQVMRRRTRPDRFEVETTIAAPGRDYRQPYYSPVEAYATVYAATRSTTVPPVGRLVSTWQQRVHTKAPELERLVRPQ